MVNRNEIYSFVYNCKAIKTSCKKLYKEDAEEALHDLINHLSILTDEKLNQIEKTNLIGYCRRVLFNKMLDQKNKNSIFEEIKEIHDRNFIEDISLNEKVKKEIINYIVNESKRKAPHFYAPLLLLEYIKDGSMEKLSAATGIPKISIYKTITKYKKHLKQKFECYPLHENNTTE